MQILLFSKEDFQVRVLFDQQGQEWQIVWNNLAKQMRRLDGRNVQGGAYSRDDTHV